MGTIRPTLRLRKLGLALRAHREAAGLTLDDAADLLKRSASSLSRIEKALHHARERDVEYMLGKYRVIDPAELEHLSELSRNGRKKGWWQYYKDDLSSEAMELISLEADAISIDFFELDLIPGLMQTPEYARNILSIGPLSGAPERIERLVAVRMKRQEILAKLTPPRLHAIISQAALHQQIGDRKVMRAQLRRLLELSRMPHVTLQILPFTAGAHKGMDGAFKIVEVAGLSNLQVVVVDSLTQISYLEQQDELRGYAEAFAQLRGAAHNEADSRELIEGLMSES